MSDLVRNPEDSFSYNEAHIWKLEESIILFLQQTKVLIRLFRFAGSLHLHCCIHAGSGFLMTTVAVLTEVADYGSFDGYLLNSFFLYQYLP